MAGKSRLIEFRLTDIIFWKRRSTVTVEEELKRIRVAAADIQTYRHE